MSYCHQPMSVLRHLVIFCKQFALHVFSATTRSRLALIFGMKHCLVDLYQVCSVGEPKVQIGPTGGLWVQK